MAKNIMTLLKDNNVPVINLRGQVYDGASNMSSEDVGVQVRIRKEDHPRGPIHMFYGRGNAQQWTLPQSCYQQIMCLTGGPK